MDANTLDQTGAQLAELMSSLLGHEVDAEPASGQSGNRPHALAVYITDEGVIRGALACDSGITNYAGAALTLMPPSTARENLKHGEVPEMIFENFSEILNICAQLFHQGQSSSTKLYKVIDCSKRVPSEPVLTFLQKATDKLTLQVEVDDYGGGEIMVVMA